MYPTAIWRSSPLLRLPFVQQSWQRTKLQFSLELRGNKGTDGGRSAVSSTLCSCSPSFRLPAAHGAGAGAPQECAPATLGLSDVEELRRAWEADPSSVDGSWDSFFRSIAAGGHTTKESMQLLLLIRDVQDNGHLMAKLDPLGLDDAPDGLDLGLYGFTEADLDREIFLGVSWSTAGFLSEGRRVVTLREILGKLLQAYCGAVGYEYAHIPDRDRRDWLRNRIETTQPIAYSKHRRLAILDSLIRASRFETFLATQCPTTKRYGLDGGEALVPGVEALIDRAADLGVEHIVMDMAHRGRLNVMANVLQKPMSQIFSELTVGLMPVLQLQQGSSSSMTIYTGTGDLHLQQSASCDRRRRPTPITTRGSGRGDDTTSTVHLSLVAHPSHLEAVDPVVMGKTRAKQFYSDDVERTKVMGVLVHGDGAFAGQGVVYETLNLSGLDKYTTGGTVHIIVNNRIASTADASAARSSHYCTDVAKALGAPVFHVNGDDVEAVVHVCELAAEWRQTFHTDVVVDLICYRRFGHTEVDDPTVTQPKLYQVIKNHPSSCELYTQKLVKMAEISNEDAERISDIVNKTLHQEFAKSKDYVPRKRDWLSSSWTGFKPPEQISLVQDTGVSHNKLRRLGQAITELPQDFKPHQGVKRVFEQRAAMVESGEGIDWAFAELLAFATLLEEGYHVRLSGQDAERGTFVQRHAILHDQETGGHYCPLDHIVASQNDELFTVSKSLVSEYAVLGFEMGYSMENPSSLVLWEAQLGDFSNCAQVIFDQFLSCGEAKWLRQTGLVVLLPHGYDGQGPDHSSARLERFLQMCDDNPFVIPEMEPTLSRQIQECNWQVVNVTTPANYFHVLRRQMHRQFRKPLIVMAPKNLLRHKDCKSNLAEFDDIQGHPRIDRQGTRFRRLIEDDNYHTSIENSIVRLILCSGKVYYELDEERRNSVRSDVAICRVEQLCPFPYDLIKREIKRYPNAEIVWCQEEPMNMGAYSYIAPRLHTAMKDLGRGSFDDIKYVGRPPSAAAATGFPSIHAQEQMELLKKALQPEPIKFP